MQHFFQDFLLLNTKLKEQQKKPKNRLVNEKL